MINTLLIPIKLHAFYSDGKTPIATPVADFSKLPFFYPPIVPKKKIELEEEPIHAPRYWEINSNNPFLGSTVYRKLQPTHGGARDSRILPKGLHLHWAMPDALTIKRTTTDKVKGAQFPSLPNRWLIRQSVKKAGEWQECDAWVVESDYLYPATQNTNFDLKDSAITYPVFSSKDFKKLLASEKWPSLINPTPEDIKNFPFLYDSTFRFMGRAQRYEDWVTAKAQKKNDEYLSEYHEGGLTAVGYGHPLFAAMYSNCFSVFGLHDDLSNSDDENLERRYELIGWYSDQGDDCMQLFKALATDKQLAKQDKIHWAALFSEYQWRTQDNDDAAFPARSLYYARLNLDNPLSRSDQLPDPEVTQLAVGNTGTEAYSAYLATQLKGNAGMADDKVYQVEEQLEALHLLPKISSETSDLDYKFAEARHDKGYKKIHGGDLWAVRQINNHPSNVDTPAHETDTTNNNVTLPNSLAHLLNDLNKAQWEYDRAQDRVESLRRIAFSDWYRFAYDRFETEDDGLPRSEKVLNFSQNTILVELEEAIADAGKVIEKQNVKGETQYSLENAHTAHDARVRYSWAHQLLDALHQFNLGLQAFNQQLQDEYAAKKKGDVAPQYTLLKKLAPRFYQPTDPVIVIEGDAAKDTDRHGADGQLACQLLNLDSDNFTATLKEQGYQQGLFQKVFQQIEVLEEVKNTATDKEKKIKAAYKVKKEEEQQRCKEKIDVIQEEEKKKIAAIQKEEKKKIKTIREEAGKKIKNIQKERDKKIEAIHKEELKELEKLRAKVTFINQCSTKQVKQPWHPLSLEWSIQYFPELTPWGKDEDAEKPPYGGIQYPTDFMQNYYQLDVNEPDFKLRNSPRGDSEALGGFYLSGSTILMSHLPFRVQKTFDEYLERLHLLDVFHFGLGETDIDGDWETTGIQVYAEDLISWSGLKLPKEIKQLKDNANKQLVYKSSLLEWMGSQLPFNKVDNIKSKLQSRYILHNGKSILWADEQANKKTDNQEIADQKFDARKINDPLFTITTLYDVVPDEESQDNSSNQQNKKTVLSQSLGGFHDALLTIDREAHLPVWDRHAMAYHHQRQYANKVSRYTGNVRVAPTDEPTFLPIRHGSMRIHRLTLLDNFGRYLELKLPEHNTLSERMTAHRNQEGMHPAVSPHVYLPPRLTQEARLNFRWLAAEFGNERGSNDDYEMNDHPATTPICGWVIPNHLEHSLVVYDNRGVPLGALELGEADGVKAVVWRNLPGINNHLPKEKIANPHLRHFVQQLMAAFESGERWESLLSSINQSLENIDPKSFAQHKSLSLFIGRPMAVVRASLELEVKGLPAINHSKAAFNYAMQEGLHDRPCNGFDEVKFPIHLGKSNQLNDGLVAYWLEDDKGDYVWDGDRFEHFPELEAVGRKASAVTLTLAGEAKKVTMLVDPRASVHATSGILPVKEISLPPDQFSDVLRSLSVVFRMSPVLTPEAEVQIPLPHEDGYSWSWMETKTGYSWEQVDGLKPTTMDENFLSQRIVEGWVRLVPEG